MHVLKLSNRYYAATLELEIFNRNDWKLAISKILDVIEEQQRGSDEGNDYYFQRQAYSPTDTLMFGTGPPALRTGIHHED